MNVFTHSCTESGCSARVARREHDHGDPEQADHGTRDIPPVGPEPVEDHAPGKGPGHEHAAVRGEDPAKVGVRLQGRGEAVDSQGDDSQSGPPPFLALADAQALVAQDPALRHQPVLAATIDEYLNPEKEAFLERG